MSSVSSKRITAVADMAPLRPKVLQKASTHAPRPERAVERGDLLAVPLCILWGIGLWAWPFGATFSTASVFSHPVSFLWELPLTAARYLFGW